PPTLRLVFTVDPNLLTNPAYLAPYPALGNFLTAHPEVARNPAFFVGSYIDRNSRFDRGSQGRDTWREILNDLSILGGLAMALGLLTWLVRTLIDYRRWSRLSKVQTDVHTKLLDRFSDNEDLRAYIQSPAGSRFLQSAPISLDAGPRSMGAPLGRILWSMQAGLVLAAAGGGLQVAAHQIAEDASQPLHVLGILGIAVGAGFVASAAISFVISQRLGLIENSRTAARPEFPRDNPSA
ncbi:MAG: hypothetical protein M3N54_15905, partial [Acidobacteriota bacterium]|nr:hypothetical protein [Acidobacteriota bacterium]